MTDSHQLRLEALHIIGRLQLGLFTTIDESGFPHGRWMRAGFRGAGLRRLITLTADGSRKLDHLRRRPQVCWCFSDPHHADVVLLKGTATVNYSPIEAQDVWDHLVVGARQFAVGPLSDRDHLSPVTIETQIASAEIISPRLGFLTPKEIDLGAA